MERDNISERFSNVLENIPRDSLLPDETRKYNIAIRVANNKELENVSIWLSVLESAVYLYRDKVNLRGQGYYDFFPESKEAKDLKRLKSKIKMIWKMRPVLYYKYHNQRIKA